MALEQNDSRMEYLKGELIKKPDSYLFLPLARWYLKSGKLKEAEETCEEGLRKCPHYISAIALLGLIHHLQGDDHKAEQALCTVIQEDRFNLLAHRLLGKIYTSAGNREKGREQYRMALAICPRDEEAAQGLRELESARADRPSVSRELEGERREGGAFYLSALADIYIKRGAVQEAARIYSRLLEKEAGDTKAQEKLKELESALAQRATAEGPGGPQSPVIRSEKLPGLEKVMEKLKADLDRLRWSDSGLPANDATVAINTLGEWLNRTLNISASQEGNKEDAKDIVP